MASPSRSVRTSFVAASRILAERRAASGCQAVRTIARSGKRGRYASSFLRGLGVSDGRDVPSLSSGAGVGKGTEPLAVRGSRIVGLGRLRGAEGSGRDALGVAVARRESTAGAAVVGVTAASANGAAAFGGGEGFAATDPISSLRASGLLVAGGEASDGLGDAATFDAAGSGITTGKTGTNAGASSGTEPVT